MMIRLRLAALLLCASAAALAQSTFTAPDGAVITYTPPPAVVTPPVTPPVVPPVTPPTTGIPKLDFLVYQNGKLPGPGDDSWAMRSVTYANTANVFPGNSQSLLCVLAGPNGGWQPLFVPNGATSFFDVSIYKYLLLSIRPPVDNSGYWIGFAGNKDTADGSQIQVAGPGFTKYGPATKAGVWANYKIPLADFKLTDAKNVFKFGVADGTGLPAGTTLMFDNVGLTKN